MAEKLGAAYLAAEAFQCNYQNLFGKNNKHAI